MTVGYIFMGVANILVTVILQTFNIKNLYTIV
jgi:hypothetical protein